MNPCNIPAAVDANYLRQLISCLIKDVKDLHAIVDELQAPNQPPLFIPWSDIENNEYHDDSIKSDFVLYLNGGRFLVEGTDYSVLDDGFRLLSSQLVDVPNDYILIR